MRIARTKLQPVVAAALVAATVAVYQNARNLANGAACALPSRGARLHMRGGRSG